MTSRGRKATGCSVVNLLWCRNGSQVADFPTFFNVNLGKSFTRTTHGFMGGQNFNAQGQHGEWLGGKM